MTPAPDYPNATIDTSYSSAVVPSHLMSFYCLSCGRDTDCGVCSHCAVAKAA